MSDELEEIRRRLPPGPGKPVFEALFNDPTPGGEINQRICLPFIMNLDKTDLSGDDQERFLRVCTATAMKLVSVWGHLDRYRRIEDELIAKARAEVLPADGIPDHIENAQELFNEFDEFLVQLKSTLDHLVKIPAAVFGPRVWSLRRFGGKGKDVIKAIERNLPHPFNVRIMQMKGILFDRNEDWLETTIEMRDKVNHYLDGGLPIAYFRVRKVRKDGVDYILVPRWSPNQTLRQGLEIIWRRLLGFCEDFIGIFVFARLKDEFGALHEDKLEPGSLSYWRIGVKVPIAVVTAEQPPKDTPASS